MGGPAAGTTRRVHSARPAHAASGRGSGKAGQNIILLKHPAALLRMERKGARFAWLICGSACVVAASNAPAATQVACSCARLCAGGPQGGREAGEHEQQGGAAGREGPLAATRGCRHGKGGDHGPPPHHSGQEKRAWPQEGTRTKRHHAGWLVCVLKALDCGVVACVGAAQEFLTSSHSSRSPYDLATPSAAQPSGALRKSASAGGAARPAGGGIGTAAQQVRCARAGRRAGPVVSLQQGTVPEQLLTKARGAWRMARLTGTQGRVVTACAGGGRGGGR